MGGLAYVSAGNGLRLIDVSDPAAPVALGAVGGESRDVGVVGDVAVLAGNPLLMIDLSSRQAPFVVPNAG